jgi:hypothetical protein
MRTALYMLALVTLAAGCGASSVGDHATGTTDEVIGDPCVSNQDCYAQCLPPSNETPGGFCTVPCQTSADCPSDSACVDKGGGVCMLVCPPFDCSFLGAGYQCRDKDLHGSGGKINVCTGD